MRAIGKFFASLIAGLALLLGIGGCDKFTKDAPECVYGPPEYFQNGQPDEAVQGIYGPPVTPPPSTEEE